MNRSLFVLLLLFTGNISFAQLTKAIDIPTYLNSNGGQDTSLWFKWNADLAQQIRMENLRLSADSFHFRFWTGIQAVDILTNDHQTYFGSVTNFAQKYDAGLFAKGQYKIEKIFSEKIILDTSVARHIYNLADSLQLVKIPTDQKIKGWGQGFDGVEYLIETSGKTNYVFKTYWSPSVFSGTLVEAGKIQFFVDRLFKDLRIGDYYDRLKLPGGNYKRNGIPGIQIKSSQQEPLGTRTIFDLL